MAALKSYRTPLLLALLALVLLAGSVWAFRHHQREKQVQQITDKGSELADESLQRMNALVEQIGKRAFSPAQFLSGQDEQRERFEELRREIEKLPPEQQDRVRKEMGKKFLKQMDKMAADLLQKPKQEQDAILDGFINLMEFARKNPSGNSAGRGGMMMGGPGPGQGKSLSADERDRRRREFLDNTTPEERAHLMGAMQLIEQRRRDRGLPPMPAR